MSRRPITIAAALAQMTDLFSLYSPHHGLTHHLRTDSLTASVCICMVSSTQRSVRHLETLYSVMWELNAAGLEPAHISLATSSVASSEAASSH